MQIIKIISIAIFLFSVYCLNGQAQSKIDYSIKSLNLNPDTLSGDQKLVFNHFLNWSHKQVTEIKVDEIKKEFAKIGLYTKNNDRFAKAYFFFRIDIRHHKKYVEQWQSFKDLSPKHVKNKPY